MPLFPLGLLLASPDGGRGAGENRDGATMRWLDAQPPKSIVYVVLGSEVPLRVDLVRKLDLGLELALGHDSFGLSGSQQCPGVGRSPTRLPRAHSWPRDGTVTLGWVPWVPQITILVHGVVDAFMMHCCRNSLIEGLLYGHPLIMLQIFADQGPNTRLMEGREVGLQVTRDGDDGSFDRHDDIASGSRPSR